MNNKIVHRLYTTIKKTHNNTTKCCFEIKNTTICGVYGAEDEIRTLDFTP